MLQYFNVYLEFFWLVAAWHNPSLSPQKPLRRWKDLLIIMATMQCRRNDTSSTAFATRFDGWIDARTMTQILQIQLTYYDSVHHVFPTCKPARAPSTM